MSLQPDDAAMDATQGQKALQHGLIAALWVSAYAAEATYWVVASLFEGPLPVVLFVFAQIALVAAILGTIVYVWTMPRWNRDVMGWMWAGCLLGGLWLGMYYAPLAPVVWVLALVTTIRWLPAWRSQRSRM